jgi:TRAP-type C4-dicarboxylate transport system substrate-binding protein
MRVPASLAAAALLLSASAASSAEVTLRLSHWVPASHPIQKMGIEPWAQSIKEASGGRIEITIFPAQQLGAAPDHYDMARDGIADITHVNPGYQAGRFPIISAGELPLLITNAKAGSRAIDSWYREYAAKEMGDVKLCMAHLHDPGTFHAKKEIRTPADVKGLNVRPAHATMGRFVSLMGGASVQVPAPEAREAIARGAADAITFPWNSIYIFGIDKETRHHLDLPLYATTFTLLINKAKYEGLSEADRKVIDDHCSSEWAERFASGWADNEAAGRQKMIASPDHKIYKPTAEDVKAWREAAAPLTAEWKKAVTAKGGDADAIYDGLISTLKKHDSLLD